MLSRTKGLTFDFAVQVDGLVHAFLGAGRAVIAESRGGKFGGGIVLVADPLR